MRIPGLELYRTVEFRVDAATARSACDRHRSNSTVSGDISIACFGPALVSAVASARWDVAAALVAGVLDWQSLVVFHRAPSSVDVPEPTGAHDSARE
jgi:hypothetical protein